MTSTTVHTAVPATTITRLRHGAFAGVIAGVAFAMLAMIYGAIQGPGFWAPLRMIATTVGFDMAPGFALSAVIVGVIVHMMLSAIYGAAFALVAGQLQGAVLLASGAVFGAVLYAVNFELFAQLDQFSAFQMMAGNWFEILVHVLFGVMVAGHLLAVGSRETR